MKFGKRLGAEAARGGKETYLDYKACKRAVRLDVESKDPSGQHFAAVIQRELRKISVFFHQKEEELEAMMANLQGSEPAVLAAFKAEVLELRKFAVLNATAVIKAVKKRNRHLRGSLGASVRPLRSIDLLSQQHFFTSPKLAALSTKAEVLSQESLVGENASRMLEEYECPICLSVLENPIVLNCAHRFCWGCLLSHCATSLDHRSKDAAPEEALKPGAGLLNVIPEESAVSRAATYGCPVCRRDHLLDLDRLQVDKTLAAFIAKLKARGATTLQLQPPLLPEAAPKSESSASDVSGPPLSSKSVLDTETEEEGSTAATVDTAEADSLPLGPPLLPPQAGKMRGRLTVVLDLDGTLISSFTPRRAPSLPPGSISYVVGKGSQLNPKGVLVVERPELLHFLEAINKFAEVVLFTAGLEDYAAPICQALETRYGTFTATLFRPATVASEAYPCVKDLSRLGRDLKKTVLVDDTPLAFLQQPDNGIPIFNFRGDVDDRVLPEAILPLLEQLAAAEDVRPILHKRFDMPRWLASHGITQPSSPAKTLKGLPERQAGGGSRKLEVIAEEREPASKSNPPAQPQSEVLILSDFDKTITDCDAGDRLVGELAPELAPMLASVSQPANFVPLTNAVLSEMARRGISRAQILATLHRMGQEIPPASLQLLSWAAEQHIDVRLISDCNTVFISHILQGAKVEHLVRHMITNAAAFEARNISDSAKDLTMLEGWDKAHKPGANPPQQESSSRLVIRPRQQEQASGSPHNCPHCPANLCKGEEFSALQKSEKYTKIVYCGDGANDFCPALRLSCMDVVLARKGYDLERLITENEKDAKAAKRVTAQVHVWETHADLLHLVQTHASL